MVYSKLGLSIYQFINHVSSSVKKVHNVLSEIPIISAILFHRNPMHRATNVRCSNFDVVIFYEKVLQLFI